MGLVVYKIQKSSNIQERQELFAFFCPFYFLHFRGKNWQSYLFTGKKTASKVVVILTMKLLERVLYQFLPIWIHPTKPNQNYWSKQSTPGSVVPLAMFHLVSCDLLYKSLALLKVTGKHRTNQNYIAKEQKF